MRELILASTSPWRRRMLEDAGLHVRCESPGVDERSVTAPDGESLARALAVAKARAVAQRFPGRVVLGADQVATDGREVWGKPTDPVDQHRRLAAMRGESHDLVTGFCLVRADGSTFVGAERTRLSVRLDLTEAEIAAYVAGGEGAGCAGGYAVEGHGAFLFDRIDGDFWNVLGLPLLRVLELLRAEGWRYGAGGWS